MQGFVGFRTPVWLRRVVTMAPAFFVALMGYDATESLVISQVALLLQTAGVELPLLAG